VVHVQPSHLCSNLPHLLLPPGSVIHRFQVCSRPLAFAHLRNNKWSECFPSSLHRLITSRSFLPGTPIIRQIDRIRQQSTCRVSHLNTTNDLTIHHPGTGDMRTRAKRTPTIDFKTLSHHLAHFSARFPIR
jgi:hypothetical protein